MLDFSRPLILPRVNLNGTSKEELVRQLSEASRALNEAVTAMGQALPHGRDFQTFEDGAARATEARNAWTDRMKVVLKIQAEVLAHALAIQDQGNDRAH